MFRPFNDLGSETCLATRHRRSCPVISQLSVQNMQFLAGATYHLYWTSNEHERLDLWLEAVQREKDAS